MPCDSKNEKGRSVTTPMSNLRTGDFLTRERLRLWAFALLIGIAAGLTYLAATAHGLNDFRGRPLGTDFADVFAAGKLALEGNSAAAYDFVAHHARERAIFGDATPFYGWHYPPFFLFAAAALARLPYLAALIVWQMASFALYLAALRLLLRKHPAFGRDRLWLLLAIAFPAVFVNLTHGQNGFLTAALFAGALALLDERPFVAGAMFGLMFYKPQFAMLIPFALAADKRWRALLGLAASLAAMTLMATAAFGGDIWNAFFASTRLSREIVLEQGATGFEKIQSLFAFVRHVGGNVDVAYAAQALCTLAAFAGTIRLWHTKKDATLKGAGLVLAALLAAPYCLDYDMTALAPAIALGAANGTENGFFPYEKSALALLWFAPIAARATAGATYFPLGLAAMAFGFALILRRATQTP
jgi:alpha-1,2-mannosyltransferase